MPIRVPPRLFLTWRALRVRPVTVGLIAVIVVSLLLAGRWVFLVPIDESPDEDMHLDYALSIYSAGGLITVRQRPQATTFDRLAHPESLYLAEQTGLASVRHHPFVPMPREYGTAAYYRLLDRDAPAESLHRAPSATTRLLTVYPFGYYALLAGWLALASHFGSSIVFLFFAARFFSVFLLAVTLLLTYGICRELHLSAPRSLAVTAIIGCFPLTTFVSSYVQPDALSWALVSLAMFLTLRLRRRGDRDWSMVVLGMSLGVLLVTKQHFYLCVVLVAVPLLLVEHFSLPPSRRRWLLLGSSLVVPSLVLGLVHLWVVWGSPPAIHGTAEGGFVNDAALRAALQGGPRMLLRYIASDLRSAFVNFYLDGTTAKSFWGVFGWLDTNLVIGPRDVDRSVRGVRVGLTVLVLILMAARSLRIGRRITLVARRTSIRQGLRVALDDPVLNGYIVFTTFMLGLFVVTNDSFNSQGRNWLPFILPAFLAGTWYAPRSLPWPRVGRGVSTAMMLGLAVYCVAGQIYAIPALAHRYYAAPLLATPARTIGLPRLPDPPTYAVEYLVGIGPWRLVEGVSPRLPHDTVIAVGGWAIDREAQSAASRLLVSVDDTVDFPATYGDDRQDVANSLENGAYRHSGFHLTFAGKLLSPGPHYLTLKIVTRDEYAYYESAAIPFEIAP